eukprot:12730351-Prorocentrum_lima.AAC.1
MTSSLVGSEMCIRDRYQRGRKMGTCTQKDAPHRKQQRSLQVNWGKIAPVSYTHLTLPTICSV